MTTEAGQTIETLAQQVRDISATEGKLPAERILADQLGVNRYVLRKALRLLRATAELPSGRRRVSKTQRLPAKSGIAHMTSPAECWEVRLSLEPEIARLAAVRGTKAEIEAIEAAHARSDALIFDLEIDIEFHRAIAIASHNALALNLIEQIMEITRDPGFRAMFPAFTAETGWRHHQMIAEAIRNRHASEAENAMRTHLTAILQWLNGGGEQARVPPK
ncbi:FadR/GntR family transcriptional regulator [Neorhizobium galegae]|uniref:FadR/GntR family transcriptional regulator n=1 Tax=Neorhizobium galegae TaxID=399 RepID=UPI000622A32A|nr:FCD domain-containing protein [Neorhizobium galegae]KAB1121033.1 FadR family transcriptional regulator [Neorhizobium galegae]CDZ60108.1 Regulatory protein, GntR:Bacterial regulatory protein, GntR [Neorhizobium galegae bv. orientalis]CDZ64742.1 Regulatory protein, GntR:Bacterial regulatory protein, GntR [Neorhizobium galegae bv. orientalis]